MDLPNGTRWHQTEKGEVFFINDMARTTSWIHPRVEHQLIKEKVRNKMRFQTDALKSLCDWLALSDSIFDWLRVPSGYHQFETLP